MSTTMSISGIRVDTTRGFDVVRNVRHAGGAVEVKVIDHFTDYDQARARASEVRGSYIRYWGVKPQ